MNTVMIEEVSSQKAPFQSLLTSREYLSLIKLVTAGGPTVSNATKQSFEFDT